MGTELITFGVSFLLKAVQSHMANSQEIRKLEIEAMTRNNQLQHDAAKDIRESYTTTSLLGWTASVLAIMGFFAVVVWPKIVAVMWPYVEVVYAHEAIDKGFMFFTSDVTNLKFQKLYGIVITPLDLHMISAICGLYFGSFSTGRRKL